MFELNTVLFLSYSKHRDNMWTDHIYLQQNKKMMSFISLKLQFNVPNISASI